MSATLYTGDEHGGLVVARIDDELLIAAEDDLETGFTWKKYMSLVAELPGGVWRLPTRLELSHLREKKDEIGCTQTYYWSADEYSSSFAWYQYFSGPLAGNQYFDTKSYTYRGARPVRRVAVSTSHFPAAVDSAQPIGWPERLDIYRAGIFDGFELARGQGVDPA